MAIYPGAVQQIIPKWNTGSRMSAYNRMNLHVAASEGESLFGFFSSTTSACSHFYVSYSGRVYQYMDTTYRSKADLDGNDASISVETAGLGAGSWTEAQLNSLAALYAWARNTHCIANKLAISSKIGDESKGLSSHRLGCDGNFPSLPSPLAGRGQRGGGMKYSSSRGKVCPGDARVLQMREVFNRSQYGATPVSNPVVAPPVVITKPIPSPARNLTADGNTILSVDGWLGNSTIARWSQIMGTPIDGMISTGKGGSSLVRAVQARLGITQDGFGIYTNTDGGNTRSTNTVRALQAYLGTYVDGKLSAPSDCVKALQRRLNESRF